MNRPERIYNVSQTQLSVARFYGGCKFQGADYHYDAENVSLSAALGLDFEGVGEYEGTTVVKQYAPGASNEH